MKKILILLFIPLFLSGCFDYNELNDLAIISGVGIDYINEEYVVTFEILSTKKQGDSSSASSSTYNVTGHGKTVTEAFANNGNFSDKVPYYDHIEVVVISEEIAKNHLKDISEYLIRSSKFRNEFYLTITSENTAAEIINATSTEKPIASTFIVDMLENSNDSNSAGYYAPFTKTLQTILTDGEDAIAPIFKLEDKKIALSGLGVFQDFELKYVFNTEEAAILNLLNNFKSKTVFFENSCANGNNTVISIYEAKVSIEPSENEIKIKAKLDGRINEDNCNYDLKKAESYQELESIFKKIIESKMDNVLNKLKLAKSNALKIGKNYYNKYRKKDFYLWTTQNVTYDLNFKINKKGLIFEVKK